MDKNNAVDNIIIINENDAGQRFDKFLIRRFKAGGKGFVYKMLRKKRVKLNDKRAGGNEILCIGDKVTFYISPKTQADLSGKREILAVDHPKLDVLYEDQYVLVVNKPSDCLTHPNLTDAATLYMRKPNTVVCENDMPGTTFNAAAVNRLDRNTTGIVIIAKTLFAAQELSRAIRNREIEKYYIAAVYGAVKDSMTLVGGYSKDSETNRALISSNGKDIKEAVTEIRPLRRIEDVSVLEVKLTTGRGHQIRAHLQSAGWPIIGDPKYGDANVNRLYSKRCGIKRQALHAWRVVFHGLRGRLDYLNGKEIICPPPKDLTWFLTCTTKPWDAQG